MVFIRAGLLLLAMALLDTTAHAAAAQPPPRTVLFPFEWDDTSLEGDMHGPRADEQGRLQALNAQLRQLLRESGQYAVMDTTPPPSAETLRTCDGCETSAARALGAQACVIGWVQKVSNLILNINLVVRDSATGQKLAAGSVDIRGNTDESWSRGLAYLVRHRILPPAPKQAAAP